jgi:predicted MFS family arabinose efflux permease
MIAGIMIGSLAAGRVAHFWRPERTIRIGFYSMAAAAIVNLLSAAFFKQAVPWAVIPIMLCTFGMAFVSPAMTVLTLDLYPSRRGMAASLQSALAMSAFSIYSGFLGASPVWKCSQAGLGSVRRLSGRRGVLGLCSGPFFPSPKSNHGRPLTRAIPLMSLR